MSKSIIHSLLQEATGGLLFNGTPPSTDTPNNNSWSPQQAENDFITNTFGPDIGGGINTALSLRNGGLGDQVTKKAMTSLTNLFNGNGNPQSGDDASENSDD